ncbi:MAG: hypothetical protein IT215_05280 [Chitinophagaceae bacterium]|nr:hypothetical protein [Chitinophagaceae bacterium]
MKRKKQLYQDILILTVSLGFAIFILRNNLVYDFILRLNNFKWIAIFINGLFFSSFFTVAPSIAFFIDFAKYAPIIPMSLLGGVGAMLGDYIIFLFFRDRIFNDFKYILSFSKKERWSQIFKTKLFRFLLPFLGALIIVSPLPDEIGVIFLGFSEIKSWKFLVISVILNSIGIYIIGLLGQLVI